MSEEDKQWCEDHGYPTGWQADDCWDLED